MFRIDECLIPDGDGGAIELQVVVRDLWQPLVVVHQLNEALGLPPCWLVKISRSKRTRQPARRHEQAALIGGCQGCSAWILLEVGAMVSLLSDLPRMYAARHHITNSVLKKAEALSLGLTHYLTTLAVRAASHLMDSDSDSDHVMTENSSQSSESSSEEDDEQSQSQGSDRNLSPSFLDDKDDNDDKDAMSVLSWDPDAFESWEWLDHVSRQFDKQSYLF